MGGGTGYLDKKHSKTELRYALANDIFGAAICNRDSFDPKGTALTVERIAHVKFGEKELSRILERFTEYYTYPEGIDIAKKDERPLMVKRNFAICAMTDMLIKTQELAPYHTSLIIGFENNSLNKSLIEYNWATLSPFIRRALINTDSVSVAKAITMARSQIIQE